MSEGSEGIIESLRRSKAVLVLFHSRSRNVKNRLLASLRLCLSARIISASTLRITVQFYIAQKLLEDERSVKIRQKMFLRAKLLMLLAKINN